MIIDQEDHRTTVGFHQSKSRDWLGNLASFKGHDKDAVIYVESTVF